MLLPINDMRRPTRLIITEVLQYRFKVEKIFLVSTLSADILRASLVLLKVQKQLTKATTTPIALNEKPDAHTDWEDPALRTVLANVKITALITLRTIWNHLQLWITCQVCEIIQMRSSATLPAYPWTAHEELVNISNRLRGGFCASFAIKNRM